MKKIISLFIFLFVFISIFFFKQVYFAKFKNYDVPSYRFVLQTKKTLFFSARNFNLYIPLLRQLRNTTLPFIGAVNKFLYSVEYEVNHKLTKNDFEQLLGKDFTIQFQPYPLFIARVDSKDSVFFFLKVKNDKRMNYKGFDIKKRDFQTMPLTLYYVFAGDFLFVSAHLKTIKRILSGYVNKYNKIPKSSFIFYNSDKISFLQSWLNSPVQLVYGNHLSSLQTPAKENGQFSKKALFSTSLNLSKLLNLKTKNISGTLILHSLNSEGNYQFSFLLPVDLDSKIKSAVQLWIKENFTVSEKILFHRRAGQFDVYSNDQESHSFFSSPILFYLNPKKLSKIKAWQSVSFLSDMESIKVVRK